MTAALDLVAALARGGGQPRLTWYGPDGERVELSGAVTANWVDKVSNFLVEELECGPGSVVLVDLPPHWRAVVWAAAAWRVGATVAVPGASVPAETVVTDLPAAHPAAANLVAQTLSPLARTFGGELPRGAIDAAPTIMTYADQFLWSAPVDEARAALAGAGLEVTHAGLADELARRTGTAARTLLDAPPDRGALGEFLLDCASVLVAGGSLVLLDSSPRRSTRADVSRTERVTVDRAPSEG